MTFNEDSRVKIPALIHLEKLGYEYLPIRSLEKDPETNIDLKTFTESLKRINPESSDDEIEMYKKQVLASLGNDDLGKVFYSKLINQSGVRLIDFDNFDNNSFNCVTEYECEKGLDSFRPDITILVNGLPLVFIEVKKPNNKDGVLAERRRIDERFANRNFRKFLNLTQFMIFSNNMEYDDDGSDIQGAFYATTSTTKAKFNFFREEILDLKNPKFLNPESNEDFILQDTNLVSIKHTPEFQTNKNSNTPTNRILTSMLSRNRIQFLLRYGITYAQGYDGLEKHIMRYPQIFATFNIKKKIIEGERKGIVWHTQGSGKTALAYYNTRYLYDYFQKENKIAKFYFIVDRLNLLKQAKSEFLTRSLKVKTINTKTEFLDDFTKNQAISNVSGELEITIINIQKFTEDAGELFNNDYDLNIQRVFFIDEAHRSYKESGSFFANLMNADRKAIHICLTGTPLIGEFASKKIFGNYIHKYFYNSSILDGYTLRLMREEIESSYSTKLKKVLDDLEVEKGELPKNLVLSHRNFVKPMLEYIFADLLKSRNVFADASIGGMVVCDSSEQAREMKKQFDDTYALQKYTSALILHDEGTKDDRDDSVEDFKAGEIDILFVYNMLLTGFDAPRLKKIYLGRVVKDHNLLQTLTRVNRPFNNFRFGYVVDFADISKEFDKTNAAYLAELQQELGDDFSTYSNLFLNPDEINENVIQIKNDLFNYDLENAEIFSTQISRIDDKKVIRSIISSLQLAKDMHNVIRAYNHQKLLDKLDYYKLRILLGEANNRLDLILLKERIDISDETRALLNSALENITFTFDKTGEEELKIGNKYREKIKQVRETLAKNFDEKDPEFLKLYDELKRILSKRNINPQEALDIDADIKVLEQILIKARALNESNKNLAHKYNGDAKYARLHKEIRIKAPKLSDIEIHDILTKIQNVLSEMIISNNSILNNRDYFETQVLSVIATIFDTNSKLEQYLSVEELQLKVASEYFAELAEMVA